MNDYFIKNGYQCNLDGKGGAIPFDDDETSAATYQVKVYRFAAELIRRHQLQTVLDIGCGYGLKLKEIIYPVCKNIVGIDREHAVNYCVQNHHFGKWQEDDIDNPSLVFKDTFDLIIVSDVIEHLVNPDKLLDYIKQHSNRDTYIIVSTPERDVIHGKKSIGPPRNRAHVREWNRTEFRNYFHSSGLGIVKHFMIGEAGLSIVQIFRNVVRRRPLKKCQVVLCHVIQ